MVALATETNLGMKYLVRVAASYNQNQALKSFNAQSRDRWDTALGYIGKRMGSSRKMPRFMPFDNDRLKHPKTRLQKVVTDIRTAVSLQPGSSFYESLIKQAKQAEEQSFEEGVQRE